MNKCLTKGGKMKQYDLDALYMRSSRICTYMLEIACLIRIWAELAEDNCGYYLQSSDLSSLASLVVKYANRLQRDVIRLKSNFEYPISTK